MRKTAGCYTQIITKKVRRLENSSYVHAGTKDFPQSVARHFGTVHSGVGISDSSGVRYRQFGNSVL